MSRPEARLVYDYRGLAKFEPNGRYATPVAVAIESRATVTDVIIDLHDCILGLMFNTAKNKHQ